MKDKSKDLSPDAYFGERSMAQVPILYTDWHSLRQRMHLV